MTENTMRKAFELTQEQALELARNIGADIGTWDKSGNGKLLASFDLEQLTKLLNGISAKVQAAIAHQNQDAVPIYQVHGQFGWLETNKEYFDTVTNESRRRIVYLAPPQPQDVNSSLEAAAKAVYRAVSDLESATAAVSAIRALIK